MPSLRRSARVRRPHTATVGDCVATVGPLPANLFAQPHERPSRHNRALLVTFAPERATALISAPGPQFTERYSALRRIGHPDLKPSNGVNLRCGPRHLLTLCPPHPPHTGSGVREMVATGGSQLVRTAVPRRIVRWWRKLDDNHLTERKGSPINKSAPRAGGGFQPSGHATMFDLLDIDLPRLREKTGTPGMQLAICRGGQVRSITDGVADHETGAPLRADAAVPIGSITKVFTAVLVLALVADDEVDLDAPIADYLAMLRGTPIAGVTVRQLLTHTSGVVNEPPGDGVAESVPRYLRAVAACGTLHEPGSAFSYANAGSTILGAVAAQVTGLSWAEAVAAVVLDPLGIAPRFVGSHPVVRGHAVGGGRVRPVDQAIGAAQAAAGGLACSAEDLVRLGRALLAGGRRTGLDEVDFAAMLVPEPAARPVGLADGWGLSLARFDTGSTSWWGHDGMANGTSCHLRVHPADGTVVGFTTNATSGHDLWRALLPALAERGLVVGDHRPPKPQGPPLRSVAGFAGDYRNGDTDYRIVARGPELVLVVDDAPSARLVLSHDGVFALCDPDSGERVQTGLFLAGSDNSIAGLQIAGRVARKVS
ncbi:serine hydrolase domain-containing protein [Actinokineospora sp. NPDC004072]